MGDLVGVGKVGELADGAMKQVVARGKDILLARVGDKYYVADNVCPHMGGNLTLGKLEGTVVTCPRHFSRFDLIDGRVIRWTNWSGIALAFGKMLRSPRPLRVYKLTIQGDNLMAEV
ncbi:MAG: Rieske 2Fe-2S domain-containing protein [Chloroflexi bacterium]|nr:Rieske 2Fe-2S domain-containing protein [Chloroflexota bacterium]